MEVLRNLIWKELSEQAWKLAFGCVILVAFVAVALETRVAQDQVAVWITLLLGAFFLPILTATGVLAREREEGDLHGLLALPVRTSVVFAVKTGVGLLTCVLPLLAAALVVLALAGNREIPSAVLSAQYSSAIVSAMALFVWTVSLGVVSRTQVTAGLVGVCVLVVSALLATVDARGLMQWTPLGPFLNGNELHRVREDPDRWIAAAFAQLPLCGLLWSGALWRLAASPPEAS